MGIALARLKIYVVYVVGYVACGSDVLVLLIEEVNTVGVIPLIPLVKVVRNNLAEGGKRLVAIRSFTVTLLNLEILCLNRLCAIALSVIAYVKRYPLRRVLGKCIEVNNVVIGVGHRLIEDKYRFPEFFGCDAVV